MSLSPPFPIALARVKGLIHRKNMDPCQDFAAWTYHAAPSPSFVVALADGAGGSKFSEEGAYLSVQKTLLFFRNLLKTPLFFSSDALKPIGQSLVYEIQTLLKLKAHLKKQPLEAFATTLLVFIATSQGYAFFQIGDGFGVIRHSSDSDYSLLLSPQKGQHTNETNFITSPNASDQLRFCFEESLPTFLALSTDGIESVALKNASFMPYLPFFKPLESFITSEKEKPSEKLFTFLSSSRFDQRSFDDRTLFLASFVPNTFSSL
ncbi:MAG: protein phosphatase 2C domain-containing protein [Proteobacteria bacterium]|nr:protein phosphatase 2C domain-containing protein [Pseudomonadota bacterium]